MNKRLSFITIFLLAAGSTLVAFYFQSKKIDYSNFIPTKERIETSNLIIKDSAYKELGVMNIEKVFNPYFLFVDYPLHFIFDLSNFKMFMFDANGKFMRSFFSSGRSPHEIMMGKFTKKPVNRYLSYADRQNLRISVINPYQYPDTVITVKLDFIPDAAIRINDSLYVVRSTDTDSALCIVSSKGKILKQFCSFSNFNLDKKAVQKSPMIAVIYQGGLCCGDSSVLIYNTYGSRMLLYSFTGHLKASYDLPKHIKIPEGVAISKGKSTSYSLSGDEPIVNLDVTMNESYVFALYSGVIPNKLSSFKDMVAAVNGNIINVFQRNTGKYLFSFQLPCFASSIDVDGDCLFAVTNVNDDEQTKVYRLKLLF